MTMDNLIVYMFVNSCWLWHKQVIIRLNCIQIHRKNLHPGGIHITGMCRGKDPPFLHLANTYN